LQEIEKLDLEDYSPAIILMTDGRSNRGDPDELFRRIDADAGEGVPVYPILFGDASEEQLAEIAERSSGRIFDGRHDLIDAFRQARGYN
jgi:Ca-activated chloride channel family protein